MPNIIIKILKKILFLLTIIFLMSIINICLVAIFDLGTYLGTIIRIGIR